jgi:hypothetical protein
MNTNKQINVYPDYFTYPIYFSFVWADPAGGEKSLHSWQKNTVGSALYINKYKYLKFRNYDL